MTILATTEETSITAGSRAPETMKAAVIRQFGNIDVVAIRKYPDPQAQTWPCSH